MSSSNRMPRRMLRNRPKSSHHRHGEVIVVCKHLAEGTSHEWRPIIDQDNPKAHRDWICPGCGDKFASNSISMDDLVTLCVECAAKNEKHQH